MVQLHVLVRGCSATGYRMRNRHADLYICAGCLSLGDTVDVVKGVDVALVAVT